MTIFEGGDRSFCYNVCTKEVLWAFFAALGLSSSTCATYFDTEQHHKPHVHVVYNGHEAVVAVDGELLAGGLPPRQMRILDGWLAKREERVYAAWNLAV